jgi:hypothetical protein
VDRRQIYALSDGSPAILTRRLLSGCAKRGIACSCPVIFLNLLQKKHSEQYWRGFRAISPELLLLPCSLPALWRKFENFGQNSLI